ncbi:MAG TPA: response regulator transcription factor [Candidatus Aphodovivens avistercoris]|nr:response regulator transcription factor [Candidatus Aphodovivens avistercoris]
MQTADTAQDANAREREGFFARHAALWPVACGLACAHMGLTVATAGSLRFTDEGVFTDGAAVVALVPLLVAAVFLYKAKARCDRRHMTALIRIAIAAQVLIVVTMGVLRFSGLCTFPVRFALSVAATFASVTCIACWLRRPHDDGWPLGMAGGAVLVFSALAISQVPVFATVLLPDGLRCLFIAPFTAAQYLCLRWARKRGGTDRAAVLAADDYFAFMRAGGASRRFLTACALGLAALSLVAGFLEGFPDGEPIPFTLPARTACFIIGEAMSVLFVVAVTRRRRRAMTVGIWIVMELLAAVTLVLYCAFPGHLEVGAIAVTLLGTLMTAFVWHLVIAYVSTGWRDPFYYAVVVWGVWTAAEAAGRFVLLGVMPTGGDSHFTGTVISLLLLISTQIILVKLIDVTEFAARAALGGAPTPAGAADAAAAVEAPGADDAAQPEADEAPAKPRALERILGLDEDSTLADARHAVARHNAELMGTQFLLSGREVEVLALYVSGFTQKRVAEELHISQTTAHTHIGRIYSKTGLHSRQELLDYMRQYGDM